MTAPEAFVAQPTQAPAWHPGRRPAKPRATPLTPGATTAGTELRGARTAGNRLRGAERFAVVTVAVVTALLPLLKPGGPSNLAPIDPLIVLALIASLLWAGTTHQRLHFPYSVPLVLMLIGGAVGALVGPVTSTGGISLLTDLLLAFWCWAAFNVSRSARNLRIILAAWVYSAVVWAIILLIGIITSSSTLAGYNARDGTRAQLTFGDPSYAASYFFITMMLMWATQLPRRRGVRYAASVMFIVEIAFTGSNSGLLSIVVGVAVAAVAGAWRRWGAASAFATLAVVALLGGAVSQNLSLNSIQNAAQSSQYGFIRNGLGRGTSVGQRTQLFTESLGLYRQGSVFGEGPASTKPRLVKSQATFAKFAHDDYLGTLTERGFIGFAGVLLLAAVLLLRAGGPVRQRLRNGYEAVIVRPNALLAAVVGTLVAASVYGLLHNRHVWTLFAIVAAVSFWGRRRE